MAMTKRGTSITSSNVGLSWGILKEESPVADTEEVCENPEEEEEEEVD